MVNVTVKMYNLQELIRKTYLEGLINNAVILFKDGRMKIEAIGVEDKQGIIDQSLTIDVNYPCETTENGDIAINNLGDLLSKLEIFERNDIVQISTLNNQLIVTRLTPPQILNYDLADKKFIKTYSEGLKTIFGNPIKLVNFDKKEMLMNFDSSFIVDAQKLKEHGSIVSKINTTCIPILIKDGKVTTELKGETSSLVRDIEGASNINGNASSLYDKKFLIILKHGIGIATLRFSNKSPLHVHFEHESMTADYLLQVYDEE